MTTLYVKNLTSKGITMSDPADLNIILLALRPQGQIGDRSLLPYTAASSDGFKRLWDAGKVGVYTNSDYSTGQLANSSLLPAPPTTGGGAVSSVAGRTGDVVLAEADITSLTTDLGATEKVANKGAVNGYAGLGSNSAVAIANGGTGAVTQQAALNALTGTQTTGRYLRSDGTNTTLSALVAGDVPTLNQNTTGTAASATKLQTARTINGIAFDGTANINTSLTPTTTKTTAYSAAVGDLVLCDATTAGFTVTLPSAPADKSIIEVLKTDSTTNTVTIAVGGTDKFYTSSGPTTLTTSLQYGHLYLQYQASTGLWLVRQATPRSSLNTVYAAINGSGQVQAVGMASTANVLTTLSAATSAAYSSRVTGDTVDRWHTNADGKHEWGPGNGAVDTNLYRVTAGNLRTDQNFVAIGSITSTGSFVSSRAANTTTAFSAQISTDTVPQWVILGSGKQQWGPGGSTAADTNLYRAAVSVLRTDSRLDSNRSAATSIAFAAFVTADTNDRLAIQADGKQLWSSGSAASDTNLYRAGVGQLKTDTGLTAGTYVQVSGTGSKFTSGASSPSGSVSGTAGDIYIQTNGAAGARLWFCTGTTNWTACSGL